MKSYLHVLVLRFSGDYTIYCRLNAYNRHIRVVHTHKYLRILREFKKMSVHFFFVFAVFLFFLFDDAFVCGCACVCGVHCGLLRHCA